MDNINIGESMTYATAHCGTRTDLIKLEERGIGVRLLVVLAGHINMATIQVSIELDPAILKTAFEFV